MSFKTVSVIVTDKAVDAPALDVARVLAEREGGHLHIYCVGVDPARYEPLPAGSAAVMLETGAAEARERADALAQWAREQTRTDGATVAVESVVVPHLGLDTGIGRLVRYSDLVVCAKPYGNGAGPLQVSALEAALFGTRAPVLVVGKGMKTPQRAPARVMVAWDESDESLDAVRRALPLLKTADMVDVVMIDPPAHSPERSDPGGGVTLMLARHGVKAEVSILTRQLPRISECLSRFAREHGDELIVMGGYGHSRFREAILGGPTRDMLEEAEVPVLMAH